MRMNKLDWRSRFIKRLEQLKRSEKLTQERLGEILGVTQGTIGHWKTGKRSPDNLDQYEKLAKALKLHPAELLYGIKPLDCDGKYVIEAWDRLSSSNRRYIIGMIDGLIKSQQESIKK